MTNSQSFGFKTEAKLSEFLRIFAKFSPVLKICIFLLENEGNLREILRVLWLKLRRN